MEIILIEKEKEDLKFEIGDIILKRGYDIYHIIINNTNSGKYQWLGLPYFKASFYEYDTIEDLIINEFGEKLYKNGKTDYYELIKNKDLKLYIKGEM